MIEYQNWLQSLKPGDPVVVACPEYRGAAQSVRKVTAGKIMLGDNSFWKSSGRCVDSSRWKLYLPRPGELKAWKRQQWILSVERMATGRFHELRTKTLKTIERELTKP